MKWRRLIELINLVLVLASQTFLSFSLRTVRTNDEGKPPEVGLYYRTDSSVQRISNVVALTEYEF
jgi:hypothetical protein